MARPSKYNWDAIKEAYEGGLDRQDICLKHKVSNKHLGDKARAENWVIDSSLKHEIDGFIAQTEYIANNVQKLHPLTQDLVLKKLDTMEQDNELIGNNRKIAKMLQGVIVSNRNAITLSNIKNVSGVLKDIESIASPQSARIDITNTNAQQNNNTPEIVGYGVRILDVEAIDIKEND